MRTAARNAYTALTGASSKPADVDLVMFCQPPGTNGGWIAYAYINSWESYYNNNWCTFVSAQLHEIGHNLNLAHSGVDGLTGNPGAYGDVSGFMGYSSSIDDHERCFNGAKRSVHPNIFWICLTNIMTTSTAGNLGGFLISKLTFLPTRQFHGLVTLLEWPRRMKLRAQMRCSFVSETLPPTGTTMFITTVKLASMLKPVEPATK